ncbi:MAG: citrate synthase [Rhodothermales bacterium]
MPEPSTARGLEGVIALESSICHIDGQQGELVYAGYDIADLAANCTFEEVAWLLWTGALPTPAQLADLNRQLCAERALPPMVLELLAATPEDANPMAVLRTAVSMLALFDGEAEDMSREANLRKSIRLTARIPTILAAFDRRRNGRMPIRPLSTGSTAANFLYMLSGAEPGAAAERTFDACLILHAEHGLNASTFAGRVIAATLSDIYSAISGAIGGLKGPLHGGANIKVMEMLEDMDRSGADPATDVRARLARKERIMGFGHRVYKTVDPRATILKAMVDEMSAERGTRKWFDMSVAIMDVMAEEKGLYPNVDFFSASVYGTLDIPTDLFTPVFAMARITGWTAHLLEQWHDNRLIRPRAAYTGPRGLTTGRATVGSS